MREVRREGERLRSAPASLSALSQSVDVEAERQGGERGTLAKQRGSSLVMTKGSRVPATRLWAGLLDSGVAKSALSLGMADMVGGGLGGWVVGLEWWIE
jgi:hypothetical protein